MGESRYLDTLNKLGAVITDDHIVYTSGRHGEVYVNKDALYLHASETMTFCLGMAGLFASGIIDVVVGPAMGGIVLSQYVAFHLSTLAGRDVLSVYAEKDEAKPGEPPPKTFHFSRGYDEFVRGRRVLVVEDILTTGESVRNVVELVRKTGGHPIGVAALCNRGGVTAEQIGIQELKSLVNVNFSSWTEQECPFCLERSRPINTKVGKGRAFLAQKNASEQ